MGGRCTHGTRNRAQAQDSRIPRGRFELRASPPGRRCRTGPCGRGGERPQGHRGLVRARGRARFHTPAPAPSWGRSPRIILAGRLCRRRFDAVEAPVPRPPRRRLLEHRRPRRGWLCWAAARDTGDRDGSVHSHQTRHGTQGNPNRDSDWRASPVGASFQAGRSCSPSSRGIE